MNNGNPASPTTPPDRRRAAAPRLLAVCTLVALLPLAACQGAQVSVPTETNEFPVPLLEPLPLTIGLVLDEQLTGYVHEESLPGNGDWRIDIGPAQPAMFNNLFAGMFDAFELVPSSTAEDQRAGLQAIIQPSIEEVQFSIPSQTRTDYFEVWIRYQIKLYDEGELLAEWPIAAYGKANVQNYGLSSTSPALQAAAFAACRDAMAYFAVQFQRIPAVQAWIKTETAAASS